MTKQSALERIADAVSQISVVIDDNVQKSAEAKEELSRVAIDFEKKRLELLEKILNQLIEITDALVDIDSTLSLGE